LTIRCGGIIQAVRGEQIILDGSGSHDPDPAGEIVSYHWKSGRDSSDGGVGLSLQDANQPVAAFSVPLVQKDTTFEFTLAVTDDEGATEEDSGEVEVETPSPPSPLPSPNSDLPEEPEEDQSDEPSPATLDEVDDQQMEEEVVGEEQNADSDLNSAELHIPETIVETCFDGVNIDNNGQFDEECES
jgi:hypothetical protein